MALFVEKVRSIPDPNPNYRIAGELFWYAQDGQGVKLLRAFEYWAKREKANSISLSAINIRYAKILKKMGYEPREIALVRELG